MLKEQIQQLDDSTAKAMLNIVAKSIARQSQMETESTPEMASALQAEFGIESPPSEVHPGDLARDALLLLADDPAHEPELMRLLTGGNTRFGVDPVTAAVVITGALVVLQTEVIIEKDKKGKWLFSIKKKSASDGLLKAVAGKLSGLMSK